MTKIVRNYRKEDQGLLGNNKDVSVLQNVAKVAEHRMLNSCMFSWEKKTVCR